MEVRIRVWKVTLVVGRSWTLVLVLVRYSVTGVSIYRVAVEALRERNVVGGKVTVEYSRVVVVVGRTRILVLVLV